MDNTQTLLEARTAEIMVRFNDAFLRHEPTLRDDLIAADCEIENTTPAPDGPHHVGRAACLAVWHAIAANRDAWFEPEQTEVIVNWEEVAKALLEQLQRAAAWTHDPHMHALISALLGYAGVPEAWRVPRLATPRRL